MATPEINVGLFVAYSPDADLERLHAFVARLAEDVTGELEEASGATWRFHPADATRLPNDDPHRPSYFLDEATLRLVEGPMDMVVCVTDVALLTRQQQVVAGLASPIARVAVMSTRKLLVTPRDQPMRTLADEAVRWNGATLLLHLLGHILGLSHTRAADDLTAPYHFGEKRGGVPRFSPQARERLKRLARRAPEREHVGKSLPGMLAFHLSSALRHPRQILLTIWRSRAPLLPLSLPSLATAAVAPTLLLVFTAEIWDVGLNMTNTVAYTFALASVVGATGYLVTVQNLVFPRKEARVLTEHMAVVNVAVLLTMLLASFGLFLLVTLLMLLIVLYVFPPDLIATWPTLEDPTVTLGDKIRIAVFISTIGVLTGALAGGLESRAVIRHLALFLDET